MDIGKQFIELITSGWAWLFIVSLLGTIGFSAMALPQFIKVLRTRNTTALNTSYVVILPITNTLILIYNIVLFVITYISGIFPWSILFCICINGLAWCYGTMIIKIKNVKAAKKLNISEEEYYLTHIKPVIDAKNKAKKHK